jgi:hypothetical protein
MKKLHRERVKNRKQKYTAFTGHAIYKQYSIELPKRAELLAYHLARVKETFGKLFPDENFLTLLEAEGMSTIPAYLWPLLQEARSEHEVY